MTRGFSRYRGCGRGGGRVYDPRSDPAYLARMAEISPTPTPTVTSGGRRLNKTGVSIENVHIKPYGFNPRYPITTTGGSAIIRIHYPVAIPKWNNKGIGRTRAAIAQVYPPYL